MSFTRTTPSSRPTIGIGEEASNVFQNLAVQKLTEESDRMLVAPLRFKSVLLEEMDRVIDCRPSWAVRHP